MDSELSAKKVLRRRSANADRIARAHFWFQAFGNENINKPTTFRWFSRFKNGMESVKDEKRVGHPILHRNSEKVSQISNLIKENPRIGLRDIEEETGISKSLVGSIIKEDLQLKKTPSK
ncbi:GVQW3 [Cordylochernes scorpioides]|uniref:GVQW3 n=1 Tax=Cordylochernes scorpioides TaxID=51811 RepID=A0ABY6KAS7_9ARAC|nr:GVQW3 [Cordylochernes scorpioides]